MARRVNTYWDQFKRGVVLTYGAMHSRHVARSKYKPHHGKNVYYHTDGTGNIKRRRIGVVS